MGDPRPKRRGKGPSLDFKIQLIRISFSSTFKHIVNTFNLPYTVPGPVCVFFARLRAGLEQATSPRHHAHNKM